MAEDNASVIEELKKWTSCDIADGLLKLNHPNGGFLSGLTMYSPTFQSGSTKIVGQAFTVKFAPKTDKSAPKVQGNYIDKVPKGSVLFISQPTPHITACYGGLMSLRAQHLGATGVVIDGRLRDLQEHRNLDFPVFARSVGTTAGNQVISASEVDVPVTLQSEIQGDVVIEPGDFIVADLDGVVCVPKNLVRGVLDAIPKMAEADEKTAEAIKGGMSVEEAFKKFRGR